MPLPFIECSLFRIFLIGLHCTKASLYTRELWNAPVPVQLELDDGRRYFAVQFSLRVICNRRNIEITKQRVEKLKNYLCLSDDYAFSSYWKDDECVVLEINAKIENPNYRKIRQYIQFISGAENLSQTCSSDGWECAYFVSLDELYSNKDTVFVVCNII